MARENEILDWEELSPEDKDKVSNLMKDLNELFTKYTKEEDKPCENSTSED